MFLFYVHSCTCNKANVKDWKVLVCFKNSSNIYSGFYPKKYTLGSHQPLQMSDQTEEAKELKYQFINSLKSITLVNSKFEAQKNSQLTKLVWSDACCS